tara:strand:- start:50 stop:1291 length:1242 start_codon:yes stop_codon:yes gene_type:complete
MKKLFTFLALTISFSINAQMSDNSVGTSATGPRSVAMGSFTTASGDYSTAMGESNTASGYTSTAMGAGNAATGQRSTAMGNYTTASGNISVAMGYNTLATGGRSVAMGTYTRASDQNSLVIGQYNSSGYSATSANSFSTSAPAFVIGNGTSSSNKSDAFKVMFNGDATVSNDLTVSGILSIGGTSITSTAAELNYIDGVTSNVQTQLDAKQATISGAASTITSSNLTASRALTSNGSGKVEVSAVTSTELGYLDGVTSAVQTQLDSKLSSSGNITTGGNIIIPDSGNIGSTSDTDAITIANSGNVTFGQDVTVSGDVVISSDARLKSNIVSLGATLSKLLHIDGKSYEMKGKQKIGLLAQEIQEVFPELVTEDQNEMLSVNYQGLVPVLINAIKEQEDKISRLENLVEQLIKE